MKKLPTSAAQFPQAPQSYSTQFSQGPQSNIQLIIYPPPQYYPPPQNYQPLQNFQPSQYFPPPQSYQSPQSYQPHQNYQLPQNYQPHQNYQLPQNYQPHQNYQLPQYFKPQELSNEDKTQKCWLLYAGERSKIFSNHKINILLKRSKFPQFVYDNNHIYKFDYYNNDSAYYYCVNKHINTIGCKARRILRNNNLELPKKEDIVNHAGIECNIENLEKQTFHKDLIYFIRNEVREFYLKNRNCSIRDLHYETLKWNYMCTENQIQYWIKDLRPEHSGNLAHLKLMKDDINPSHQRLWGRIYDEMSGILILMTDLHENFLIKADIWLVDGTFKTAPQGFEQVLNIMGVNLIDKVYLTCGHILLKSKKKDDYVKGFQLFLSQIISSLHNLRLKVVITDFERALMKSISDTINLFHLEEELSHHIKIQGCLFHFSQCLVKTFSKYYPKKNVTEEMKKVLYVLLYSPYLKWNELNKFTNKLLDIHSEVNQFLLYFQKVWLRNKEIWHVGEHIDEAILTNCALESFHKRLNSALETTSSVEKFCYDLYAFDMKNLREIRSRDNEPLKYKKFLSKKDEIYELMNEIVETYMKKSDNGQIDSDLHIVDEGSEEWCEYNEQNNESFNGFLFEDSLNNNSNIINQQMNRILDQFKSD